jgi:hypothetical protein
MFEKRGWTSRQDITRLSNRDLACLDLLLHKEKHCVPHFGVFFY